MIDELWKRERGGEGTTQLEDDKYKKCSGESK